MSGSSARSPTIDEIIEHSHPGTGGGGYWIAMVGVHRTPVVVRLWSAGEWHYVDGSDEDATWVPGELLGSSSGYASARPAAEVIDGLYAEAWWRWDANGPTRLL